MYYAYRTTTFDQQGSHHWLQFFFFCLANISTRNLGVGHFPARKVLLWQSAQRPGPHQTGQTDRPEEVSQRKWISLQAACGNKCMPFDIAAMASSMLIA